VSGQVPHRELEYVSPTPIRLRILKAKNRAIRRHTINVSPTPIRLRILKEDYILAGQLQHICFTHSDPFEDTESLHPAP